jgi:hypothetical protein
MVALLCIDALVFGVWLYQVGIIFLKVLDILVIDNNITFCMIEAEGKCKNSLNKTKLYVPNK